MSGNQIRMTIYGEPIAKGRPRVALRGRFPTIYTPKETKQAEEELLKQAIKYKPETPLEGKLKVTLKFFKKKPKSYSKSVVDWTKKPDLDNMIKLVLDSLNKVFYQDDAQITELTASKEYDEVPRTEIIIEKFI